ncbi:MAG: hypothetical protein V3T58_02310 [Candidatus Hydrothermarchaeales archaeon]
MKKFLIIFLISLALLPGVEAQLYVSRYNVTYQLGEENYQVVEILKLKNGGSPFVFPEALEFVRGDASDAEAYSSLTGTSFSADYVYPSKVTVDLKKVVILKRMEVGLKYLRKEGLSSEDKINVFMFSDIGKYPWGTIKDCIDHYNECQYEANITIITPDGYYFGNITSPATIQRRGKSESIVYRLSLLRNLTIVPFGFPVRVEYADYRELTLGKIASASALLSQVSFGLKEANSSLENAGIYEANVSRASDTYVEASQLYEQALEELKASERFVGAPERDYYNSYLHGSAANELAEEAYVKANAVRNLVSFEIQRALEMRVAALGANLSEQYILRENLTKSLSENLTRLLEMKKEQAEPTQIIRVEVPEEGINYYAIAFFLLLGSIVIYGVANMVLYVRRTERKHRGKVKDFRVIGDLKRKTFKGFEQKVDTVKQEVELAADIRKLKKEREKYVLGIDNVKKKMRMGDITKQSSDSQRKKFEEQVKETDAKIDEIEKQLKGKKKRRTANEKGKAD